MKQRASIILAAALAFTWVTRAQDAASPQDQPPAETPPPGAELAAPPAADAIPAPAENGGVVTAEGLGQAIPQAYPADRYSSTWGKNPFLVEVAPTAVQQVSFAQDWALTGLTVRPSGEATAYIRNKQTQEFKRVSNVADKDGFKLVKANPNPDRRSASVEVSKGAETATLKYDEVAAAPAAPAAARIPMPGQAQNPAGTPGQMQPRPGMPGTNPTAVNQATMRRPGMPQQAGQPTMAGQVPQANTMQPNGAVSPVPIAVPSNIPRNPSNRRRILIPPPVPQDGAATQAPTPQ